MERRRHEIQNLYTRPGTGILLVYIYYLKINGPVCLSVIVCIGKGMKLLPKIFCLSFTKSLKYNLILINVIKIHHKLLPLCSIPLIKAKKQDTMVEITRKIHACYIYYVY